MNAGERNATFQISVTFPALLNLSAIIIIFPFRIASPTLEKIFIIKLVILVTISVTIMYVIYSFITNDKYTEAVTSIEVFYKKSP